MSSSSSSRGQFNPNPTDSAMDESTPRPSGFKVIPVSTSDIPELVSIKNAAFAATPETDQLFPDKPSVRKWWADGIEGDLLYKPQQSYLKVVDTKADGRIVAYAKWDLGSMEERGPRFAPFVDDMDHKSCGEFVEGMDRSRRRLMGDRKHYCTQNHFLIIYLIIDH